MANFFKSYHAQLKADLESVKAAATPGITHEYCTGDIVYIAPYLDESRNGKRFFVDYLSDNHILLAETKKEALSGYGHIYQICDIVNKKKGA